MHKLLTSQQQTSALMFGLEESVAIRRQELTTLRQRKERSL